MVPVLVGVEQRGGTGPSQGPDFRREETLGLDLVGSVGRGARRLHESRHGSVSLLVLFMGLVFYALVAMAWNTGEVTAAKIEAQTAADAAAYSSAVWTCRAINMTAASNMAILRHITALEAAAAGIMVTFGPWISWSRATAPVCAGPQAAALCWPAWLAIIALEVLPRWVPFIFQWLNGTVRVLRDSPAKLQKLYQFQVELRAAVPVAIEAQRKALEDYYDCDINLVRGDGRTTIEAPLKRGFIWNSAFPILMRTYKELLNNTPSGKGKKRKPGSWNNENELKLMFVGEGATWWTRGVMSFGALVGLVLGNFHHVLTTQYGPVELSPAVLPNGWQAFTVVAAARKRSTNQSSLQPPRNPLGFLAPGLFDRPANPVAYSQAEAFNGIDGHLPWMFLPLPWRVWTPWGWSWEPRLSHGESFALWPAARGSMVPSVADTLFTSAPHDLGVRASNIGQVLTTH